MSATFSRGRTARGELLCLDLGISKLLVGSPLPLCDHQDGAGSVGCGVVSERIPGTSKLCLCC